MSEEPLAPLLNRAGEMLRGLAEPGWDRIADTVVDAVRARTPGSRPENLRAGP